MVIFLTKTVCLRHVVVTRIEFVRVKQRDFHRNGGMDMYEVMMD